MYLNNYTHVRNFLEKYPNVDINDLDHLSDTLHYGKLLQGKTLHDIQDINTEKKLYSFASALQVPLYAQKKKHVLKSELIERYNSVFEPVSVPTITIEPQPLPTLSKLDHLIQCCLSISKPEEFNVMEQLDLDLYTSSYPIDTIILKDKTVPSKYSILEFLKFMMHELFCNNYCNLKVYKGRYYEYFEKG
jgi:hypothetical protein